MKNDDKLVLKIGVSLTSQHFYLPNKYLVKSAPTDKPCCRSSFFFKPTQFLATDI
jgi:hypothetical protein